MDASFFQVCVTHSRRATADLEAQIARGLVLPLTIAVSSFTTRTRPSLLVLLCATLVTLGFLMGVLPPSFFSLGSSSTLPVFSSSPHSTTSRTVSLLYGVLSSVFIALHAVLIKVSLPDVEGSTIKLAWWTNVGSALFLVPCILLAGELGRVQEMLNGDEAWRWDVFAWGSMVTGVFGFLLCVAGLLSIKITSPITHMFSSVRVRVATGDVDADGGVYRPPGAFCRRCSACGYSRTFLQCAWERAFTVRTLMVTLSASRSRAMSIFVILFGTV